MIKLSPRAWLLSGGGGHEGGADGLRALSVSSRRETLINPLHLSPRSFTQITIDTREGKE